VAPVRAELAFRPPGGLTVVVLRVTSRDNGHSQGVTDLRSLFAQLNQRYFDGRLPSVHIDWGIPPAFAALLSSKRLAGVFAYTDVEPVGIYLHPALDDDPHELRRILVHEMTHLSRWRRGVGTGGHDHEFEAELRRAEEAA
jgi:hypothetical protein